MVRERVAKIISIPQSPCSSSAETKFVEWVEKRMWTHSMAVHPWARRTDTIYRMSRKYRCEYSIRSFDAKTWAAQQASKGPLQDWILAIYEMVTSRKNINDLPFSAKIGASRKATWHIHMARRRTAEIRGRLKP